MIKLATSPDGNTYPEALATTLLGSGASAAEIADKALKLQTEYDNNQYSRDRVEAYPSLTDQADMAYWDRQNGTTTLDDAITAVKEAHPKPA
jgi:hypothetical protein